MPFLAGLVPAIAGAVGAGQAIDSASKDQGRHVVPGKGDPNWVAGQNNTSGHQYIPGTDPGGFQEQQAGRLQGLAGHYRNTLNQGVRYNPVAMQRLDSDIQNASNDRGQMLGATELSRKAAEGTEPSVAQLQMKEGLNNALSGQASMLANTRGGGQAGAAAARGAAQAGIGAQENVIGQSGMLRAQEMATARNEYARNASQLHAQDLMSRGMSADEAFKQAGLDLHSRLGFSQLGLGYEGLGQQALGRGMQGQEFNSQMGFNREQADRQLGMQIGNTAASFLSGIAGGGAAVSDMRAKEDIKPAVQPALDRHNAETGTALDMLSPQAVQETKAQPKMSPLVGKNWEAPRTQALSNPYAGQAQAAPPGPLADLLKMFAAIGAPDQVPAVQPALDRANAQTSTALSPNPGQALGQTIGGLFSDEKTKKQIEGESSQGQRAPRQVGPHSYDGSPARPAGEGFGHNFPVDSGKKGMENPNLWSDKKTKEGKAPGAHPIDAFIQALAQSASTYKYKNPAQEPTGQPTGGTYAGVMAQALEKVPELGPQLVKNTPQGKVLEKDALLSALAAAVGRMAAQRKLAA